MPRNRPQDNPKYESKPRKICVFLFPETCKVYVDRTAAKDLWRYYDNHYRERIAMTKEEFKLCKERDLLPEFYFLEEIFGTDSQAFARCIAWSKYFLRAGYEPLGKKMNGYIQEMDAEAQDIYQSIQNIPMQEICSESKKLFPDFKKSGLPERTQKTKLRADEHRITLYVKEKEYRHIKEEAEKYGVSMSEFLLACMRVGGIVQVDTAFLEQYIRKLDDCHSLFAGMLATYLISGAYYPADIIKMEEIAERIALSNDEAKKEIIRLCKQLRRMKNGGQLNSAPLQ